ncbi:MAG: hypothetical protein M3Q23_04745 [Actinomycetota bacterium]|nr:hypothetical protein [Actinomycetota bacterium]
MAGQLVQVDLVAEPGGWNCVRGAVPGGAPSKATHRRSGDSAGRFAFWWLGTMRFTPDPLGRIAHRDG